MTNWNTLIGTSITLFNDRGAEYRGILRGVLPSGDVLMEVHAIRLTGRLSEGAWQELRRVEVQRITGPRLTEATDA